MRTPDTSTEEQLPAGSSATVTRLGQTVRRPVSPWTPSIHTLLRELRSRGFLKAPAVHGIDHHGREILDYIPGAVGNYPLPDEVRSDAALRSAGQLLRTYHDATVDLTHHNDGPWMFPAKEPREVICHADFAPYNCVFEGTQAIAIIDFDTAHPGPRAWDLAYALYRFAPLARPENADSFGDIHQQTARACAFFDAYGAASHLRADTISMLIPRLQFLVDFMRGAAHDGHEQFQDHINQGHLALYLADMAYIQANLHHITSRTALHPSTIAHSGS